MNVKLTEIQNGKTFKVGEMEFIKFFDRDGVTVAVAKNPLFRATFGKDNNFATSDLLKRLQNEVLPEIEKAVGEENVVEFETDLLSLDGSRAYGTLKSKISLPTFDFYRHYVKVFDTYKQDGWWWLCTPDSTPDHNNSNWVVCVAPSGFIDYGGYGNVNGVRPFLHFVSSISVSCDD